MTYKHEFHFDIQDLQKTKHSCLMYDFNVNCNFILKMSSLKLGSYEWTSNAYLTHNLLWLIQGNTTSEMAETNITNESAKDCFYLLSFITITHFYGI